MITPEIKDLVLNDLMQFPDMSGDIDFGAMCDQHCISGAELEAIIAQMDEMGLVKTTGYKGGVIVDITASAHDFNRRGGFVGHEMLLKANIEKLGLEIDKLAKDLAPKQLETAEKIASIGASVMSMLGYFR